MAANEPENKPDNKYFMLELKYWNQDTGKAIEPLTPELSFLDLDGNRVTPEREGKELRFTKGGSLMIRPAQVIHGTGGACDRYYSLQKELWFHLGRDKHCLTLYYTSKRICSVTVSVVDDKGAGIAGAWAVCWPADASLAPPDALPAAALTKADGTAPLLNLQSGLPYNLVVSPPPPYSPAAISPRAPLQFYADCEPLRFEIGAKCPDRTWVFVHDGCEPLGDKEFHLTPMRVLAGGHKEHRFATNNHGLMELTVPPGEYTVSCPKLPELVFPGLAVRPGLHAQSLAAGREELSVTFDGTITFSAGELAAGVPWQVIDAAGNVVVSGETDEAGRYHAVVPANRLGGASLVSGPSQVPLSAGPAMAAAPLPNSRPLARTLSMGSVISEEV